MRVRHLNAHAVQAYIDQYYGYVQIYTDASKNSTGQTGVAVVVPEFSVEMGNRISDGLSVYTGEMIAILLAVQWVEDVRPLHAVICSDSSSSLVSLQHCHSDSRADVLGEIQQTLFRLHMMGLAVVFLWVPAHCGVWANEQADRVAKEAVRHGVVDMAVSVGQAEIRSMVRQGMRARWQKQWEEERKGRWLYKIQRRVGGMRNAGRTRREEVIISRLRFGHTGLNGTLFLIVKHSTGKCDYCGVEETVEHVMLQCQRYQVERRQLVHNLSNLKIKLDLVELLQKESGSKSYQALFLFLKEGNLFGRI